MHVPPELVHGAAEVEVTPRGIRPHRLPAWAREQFPDGQLLSMESQPSGVRVAFQTTAGTVELVTHPTRIAYVGAERPRGHIDVYADGELPSNGTNAIPALTCTVQPGQPDRSRARSLPGRDHPCGGSPGRS